MLKIIVSGNECELNNSEKEMYENIFKMKIIGIIPALLQNIVPYFFVKIQVKQKKRYTHQDTRSHKKTI